MRYLQPDSPDYGPNPTMDPGHGHSGGLALLTVAAPSGNANTDTANVLSAIAKAEQNSIMGGIFFRAGTYLINQHLPLPSNFTYGGVGRSLSIVKASGLTDYLFGSVQGAGTTIADCTIRDITIDGNSSGAGTIHLVHLDTTANNNIVYSNVTVRDCTLQNAWAGWWHGANNAAGTEFVSNFTRTLNCRFINMAAGWLVGGTYNSTIDGCHFEQCTSIAIQAGAVAFGGVSPIGSGTQAWTSITNCDVEGTLYGTNSSEYGIGMQATGGKLAHCSVRAISHVGIYAQNTEGTGSVLTGLVVWGCGQQFFYLDGDSTTEPAVLSNFVMGGGNTAHPAITVSAGQWLISEGLCQSTGTFTPGGGVPQYILDIEGTNANVRMKDVRAPGFNSGFLNLGASPNQLVIKDCEGYNPFGPVTVAVPSSGTAVAAAPYDRNFYIATGTGTTTVKIGSGSAITLPASASWVPFRVPAGQTMTPTYSVAPTWQVEGE